MIMASGAFRIGPKSVLVFRLTTHPQTRMSLAVQPEHLRVPPASSTVLVLVEQLKPPTPKHAPKKIPMGTETSFFFFLRILISFMNRSIDLFILYAPFNYFIFCTFLFFFKKSKTLAKNVGRREIFSKK
jgi:hypothetical protein